MILKEKLLSKNILIENEKQDRWGIISKLVNLADQNEYIPSNTSEDIIKALNDREETMSTGIGNNIAIPHCRVSQVDEAKIMLCISEFGIEFDSLDGMPVNLVVMLIVPEQQQNQHVRTLASIARVLMDENFKKQLIHQNSSEEAFQFLQANIND